MLSAYLLQYYEEKHDDRELVKNLLRRKNHLPRTEKFPVLEI